MPLWLRLAPPGMIVPPATAAVVVEPVPDPAPPLPDEPEPLPLPDDPDPLPPELPEPPLPDEPEPLFPLPELPEPPLLPDDPELPLPDDPLLPDEPEPLLPLPDDPLLPEDPELPPPEFALPLPELFEADKAGLPPPPSLAARPGRSSGVVCNDPGPRTWTKEVETLIVSGPFEYFSATGTAETCVFIVSP